MEVQSCGAAYLRENADIILNSFVQTIIFTITGEQHRKISEGSGCHLIVVPDSQDAKTALSVVFFTHLERKQKKHSTFPDNEHENF